MRPTMHALCPWLLVIRLLLRLEHNLLLSILAIHQLEVHHLALIPFVLNYRSIQSIFHFILNKHLILIILCQRGALRMLALLPLRLVKANQIVLVRGTRHDVDLIWRHQYLEIRSSVLVEASGYRYLRQLLLRRYNYWTLRASLRHADLIVQFQHLQVTVLLLDVPLPLDCLEDLVSVDLSHVHSFFWQLDEDVLFGIVLNSHISVFASLGLLSKHDFRRRHIDVIESLAVRISIANSKSRQGGILALLQARRLLASLILQQNLILFIG